MPRVRSPELPRNQTWLNTEHPLSLSQLRGRVVLLDFWTYGCINCLHVLPELKDLERRYAQHLTVIGIHSAKFANEGAIASVQQAILRYGITHPVLLDHDFAVWQQYAVRAWPTLVLIDPAGYIVTSLAGEGHGDRLDGLIQRLLTEQPIPDATTTPDLQPELEEHPAFPTTPLAFPGKVTTGVLDGQTCLAIADSGHHRIVIATPAGEVLQVVGSGRSGWQDGSFLEAQFSQPQGLTFSPDSPILYVADIGNHLVRQIDFQHQQVTTLAGTGKQSHWLYPHGGLALSTALNSPWDLTQVGDRLLIAMAGSHQIWELYLPTSHLQTYLGTGAEGCVDGDRQIAAFAQPSGITSDGTRLYVADSETSSIRQICDTPEPIVSTLCGQGGLFEFGDRDGIGTQAQLQHCLGLTYADRILWIADTYNHKIKCFDLATGSCHTAFGTGATGHKNSSGDTAHFFEPSGLAIAGDFLYVADTNNHAIRCIDLKTSTGRTLALQGLCAPNLCFPM